MTNWSTVASLATAAGTMVLAVATFSAVRSSTASARVAERALQIRTRPLLMTSRLDDPAVKLRWMDDHWVKLEGSRAHAAVDDGIVYLAVSVRNVASGVAVLQGWYPHAEQSLSDVPFPRPRTSGARAGTSTSPPVTWASGRARCASPTTRCAWPWSRSSRRAATSPSTCSTATTKAGSGP